MHEIRCYVATALLDGCLYACGGHNSDERVSTCEKYIIKQDLWMRIASMNVVRSDSSATVYKGKIYVAGGVNHENVENSVEVYDPQRDQWTLIEQMATARSGFVLISYHDHLLAIGGSSAFGERWTSLYKPFLTS